MRIGIDIDDTLVNTSEAYNKVLKKYKVNFKKSYKGYLNWTSEEKKFIFENYLIEILKSAEIKEDAKEVINYLSSLGHEIYIITVRGNKYGSGVEELTLDFINKEKMNIKEIFFGEDNKSQLAKKLNLDLMIDDSEYVYNKMKEEGIDCILFGDKIKTWKEILKYIKQKEE